MNMPLWAVALVTGFGCIVTYGTIPLAIKWAQNWGLVVFPGGRRNHAQATPLAGGFAVFLPLAAVFFAFFALTLAGRLPSWHPELKRMLTLFLGTTWMLVLGTVDDRLTLSWKNKLLGQFLGVFILVLGGHTVTVATVPWWGTVDFGWYGIPFLFLAIITITNAINLIDGLDGLAGGICLFAALTSAIIALVKGDLFTATLGFTLTGSLLGFLRFNFPPASIFLGDGGSMMLGFLLGTLAVSSAAGFPGQRLGTSIMILVPFLPLGIPLFEVALSVLRRWLSGQAIFLGDGNHLHHRLIGKFKNARLTVAIFYFFSASLCVLSLLIALEVKSFVPRLLSAALTLVLMLAVVWSLRLYQDRSLVLTLKNRPHFKFLGAFLGFMKFRVTRARSLEELLALLDCGVRDLGFDRVALEYQGKILRQWTKQEPEHAGTPRLSSEVILGDWGLKVTWVQPRHDDAAYNDYLILTWHRFLVGVKGALAQYRPESPEVQRCLLRMADNGVRE